MKYTYPIISHADKKLREYLFKKMKCEEAFFNHTDSISGLEKELDIIRLQGSASGFLSVLELLRKIRARKNEYYFRGTLTSSLVAYLLGFSDFNPLYAEDMRVYPEFCYGIDGEREPVFELTVRTDLFMRVAENIQSLEGVSEVRFKYDMNHRIMGAYLLPKIMIEEPLSESELFYVNFCEVDHIEHESLILPEIEKCMQPVSFEDYVRCFGLSKSSGAWDDNAEILLADDDKLRNDVIAYREDVYEKLLQHGFDVKDAYRIAEDVWKGRVYRNGWGTVDLEMMRKKGVENWFVESCQKIKYLFPRSHGMTVVKREMFMLDS